MPVPPCGPTERPGGAAPPPLLLPPRHPPRPPPLPRPPLRCIAPQPHATATAACSAPACALAVRLPFAPGTRGCACGRRAILRSGCGVAEVAPGGGSERACSPVQLLQSPRSPCRYPEHAGRARRCLHPCLSPARPALHSSNPVKKKTEPNRGGSLSPRVERRAVRETGHGVTSGGPTRNTSGPAPYAP